MTIMNAILLVYLITYIMIVVKILYSAWKERRYTEAKIYYTPPTDDVMIGTNEVNHPYLKFHYRINKLINVIHQYRIEDGGGISPLYPAAVTVTGKPYSIIITTNGDFAYVFHNDGMVSIFTINKESGHLIAAFPSKVPFSNIVGELEKLLLTQK